MSDILRNPNIRAGSAVQTSRSAALERPASTRAETAQRMAADEALAMRERAAAEAQSMRAKLLAEADALRASAQEEGYRAGMAKAEVELGRLRQQADGQIASLLDALGKARLDMQAEMENLLTPLLLESLLRVIGEMQPSPELVRACVDNAVKEAMGREPVTVRLSPRDAALLEAAPFAGDAGRQVSIVADSALEAGGCVVETAHGDIEAGVLRRIERLRQALQEAGAR
ncbi:FliH/SctL family protein [Chromobacterium alticapitis]|uniref:Flagellar assembly protein FliH n=1 Tax=Chromobacterium alticapitis TaxID=2073169 RepID=A0A2S5DL13_9NEIS|nr:FliH/SctL family protein [Chromobacterium alticapitis]POZ63767.1 hypothetical protein C2I19_01565 [Chromobacterium alticapitis]